MIRTKLWRVGAVLALASTALMACSDDDDNGTPPGTGGEAGASTGGASSGGNGSGGTATGGNGGNGGLGGNGGTNGADDLIDVLNATGNHSRLAALLEQADLVDTLREDGPYTLFAPTDDAFDEFDEDNPELLEDLTDDELSNLLRYHATEERLLIDDLEDEQELETLADDNPTITVNVNDDITLTDENILTDDATVTESDIEATNGVVHSIDKVMLPPDN